MDKDQGLKQAEKSDVAANGPAGEVAAVETAAFNTADALRRAELRGEAAETKVMPSAFADREEALEQAESAQRVGGPRGRSKVIAACVAALCVGLIGVSGFALVGGFDQPGDSPAAQEASGNKGDALQDPSAPETQDGDTSAGDVADVASDGAGKVDEPHAQGADGSSTSASAGGGSAASGSQGGGQADPGSNGGSSNGGAGGADGGSSSSGSADKPVAPEPQTVTVTISADGSVGGGSTSGPVTLTFEQGATVYDAVQGAGWIVAANSGPMGVYVESINGVAEDAGHGWTYYVNGGFPGYSCAYYELADGDVIEWRYVVVS